MASWSDRDIRVSVILNPMFLVQDLANLEVEGRTVSVAGSKGAPAVSFPRTQSSPATGFSTMKGQGRAGG